MKNDITNKGPVGTINEFYTALSKYRDENPTQRRGQAVFNVMSHLHQHAANAFRGGINDPFHDDSKSDFFIELCFNILFFDEAKDIIKQIKTNS